MLDPGAEQGNREAVIGREQIALREPTASECGKIDCLPLYQTRERFTHCWRRTPVSVSKVGLGPLDGAAFYCLDIVNRRHLPFLVIQPADQQRPEDLQQKWLTACPPIDLLRQLVSGAAPFDELDGVWD
jgi:hypothetical protein